MRSKNDFCTAELRRKVALRNGVCRDDSCSDDTCRNDAWAEDGRRDGARADDARPDNGWAGAACAQELGREEACPRAPLHHELTVGEVAKRSGVAVSAIHFYESKGLITSRRSPGNHRLYPRDVLRRIAIIKVAQRTGMALEEIGKALDTLPDGRTPTKADWTRMSEAWKADLEARIARLIRLRDQLDQCIGCGCLSIADCPLRNPDDRLAATGAGPRLLDPD